MSLRKISHEEINEMLRLHYDWTNYPYNDTTSKGKKANFHWLDLVGVNFFACHLRGANFSGADLRGANFSGADLRETNFKGANLQGTKFHMSDLRFADLRFSKPDNSIQTSLSLACSKWHRSDVPWWLGHKDQDSILLFDE